MISLTSFRIGFRWYLAIAGSSSKIYRFNGNGALTRATKLKLDRVDYWQVIPVNTYRQDVIILARKSNETSVISGVGNGEFKVHGDLTNLICNNGKGLCLIFL